MTGLSPRVRGNPRRRAGWAVGPRSIPARTGEPCTRSASTCATGVYPRAYGGTSYSRCVGFASYGLSPRVRGNQALGHLLSVVLGSIPARTGEPMWLGRVRRIGWVYPRAYGGTARISGVFDACRGLSPRVRGNRLPPPDQLDLKRSIPARTGEPSPSSCRKPRARVYPRAYGGTDTDRYAVC